MSNSARSPLSGCAILIAAVLMLVFLIGFSIWTPLRQADEIEKFTQDKPSPVPSESIEQREDDAKALVERLETFRSQLSDDKTEARIELSADDLNLAVALFEQLEQLRGAFHVREIADEVLKIDICYQLNGRPRLTKEDEEGFVTSDPRYLVGELIATPQLGKRELALRVEDLNVEDAEVAEGFMGHFSTLRIFEQSMQDPAVGPPMAKLTRAEIDGDKLVLARIPGEAVPETVSDEEFREGGGKIAIFLGAAMLVFLILAGTLLFVGYKAQLRKIAEESDTKSGSTDA
ncbi:hypothetical protein [Haloferula helveola]|uniref:hypothetical protein n=1 Tax=Haloferula helveola TaxID=490095 RepID=UPI0030CAE389